MRGRLWGLTARQTVVLFAFAILVGVVVAVVVGPSGSDDDEAASRAPITRVRPGTPGPQAAVWVFGFETLRFDPDLTRARQLRQRGFGDVGGAPAAVYLYDAGSGRVGALDATRNQLRDVALLAAGTSVDMPFVPTLVAQGSRLWVTPNPGELVQVDPADGTSSLPVAVADVATARRTGLAATVTALYAATVTSDGVVVARVDAGTGSVTTAIVDAAALDGLAADEAFLWVRSGTALYGVDPATLAVARRAAVPAWGAVGGLVAADGAVWMLTDGGATLTRYDPGRDRFTRAARLVDRVPDSVELPASLVSDGRRIWAMVQRAGARDLAVRVIVHDPRRDRTRGVDVPGRIAPGALAVSTRGTAPP